ncbi:histidine kinase [Alteromonas lipolytica]|uniref:histidine kinase n=1 Tax=Alteromonas lipolytica TaxID=1856405 RepID=A0A1E8FDQ4_9ALTE|nr:histidine kinase [Alteromonas lipolytica]
MPPFFNVYLALVIAITLAFVPLFWLLEWPISEKAGLFAVTLIGCMLVMNKGLATLSTSLGALKVGLLNFKDGEFSNQLVYREKDPLGDLCLLYNESAEKLRQEKRWLHQRELMLDKVLQSSPEILLLVNDDKQVVFSNYAARDFFQSTSRLEGFALDTLLENLSNPAAVVLREAREGLFTLPRPSGESETWHLSIGQFVLNNQLHRLFILKQMTRELSRQEVAVWKKVIRIISHELNNSIGPVSSMLHSGKLLSENLDEPRLSRVFATISERIAHLSNFVQGYGKFAKLPEPQPERINRVAFISQLQQQWPFHYQEKGEGDLYADTIQLEQLLINLLKNAHESDSAPEDIMLTINLNKQHAVIEVSDGGKGMTETVLSQALIPFYSTKSTGSGLGLALCREIAEAHHGQIVLQNRSEGGLTVRVSFPTLANI